MNDRLPDSHPPTTAVVLAPSDPVSVASSLDALAGLDFPARHLRVVVAGARRGREEWREVASHPTRPKMMAPGASGLAAALNRGTTGAKDRFFAFLGTGCRPEAGWLAEAVDAFDHDGSLGCVASRIVDPAGTPIFEGADVSLLGLPLAGTGGGSQAGRGEVLYPSAAAMVVRADAFRELGGFDERFGNDLADLDLGWRGWLLGWRVRVVARSTVVFDRAGAAGAVGPVDQAAADRNALFSIFKNYDDANLGLVLPAAVLLAGRRSRSPQALDAFLDALPGLATDREAVQRGRRRPDAEIVRLFGRPLDAPFEDDGDRAAHRDVVVALGLADRFGSRRRVVVATADTLSTRMAGPAIRAWNIAAALSREHEVRLATTTRADVTHPGFEVLEADDATLAELERWCDVFVFQGWVMRNRAFLRTSRKVLVADIYDPMHLEQLEQGRDDGETERRLAVQGATATLNEQLLRGDYFLCASEKQRDFWLGQLAALGRLNPATYDEDETLASLVTVVPFGVSDQPPTPTRPAMRGVVPGIGPGDAVILWGGGIYNWFDPLTLIRAVDRLRQRRPDVRLFFLGLRHPNADIPEMRMARQARSLAADLGLEGKHVFFNEDWVGFDDRQNFLLEADIGVSTHLDHVETEFSSRTRVLDYLWASLPVVTTAGDALADLVEERGLGLTVPPRDDEALEDALFRLLEDGSFAASCRENIEKVVPDLVWSEVLRPLIEFCRSPRRAPDLVDPELSGSLAHALGAAVGPRPGWRADVRIAMTHLRTGGPTLVARKAWARLRRVFA